MIDVMTHEPLQVSVDGDAPPYIMLPETQLAKVTQLLDEHKVVYWVDDEAISLDGEPETTVINLSYRSDPAAVQQLLDSVP